jgi:hypothetical protein
MPEETVDKGKEKEKDKNSDKMISLSIKDKKEGQTKEEIDMSKEEEMIVEMIEGMIVEMIVEMIEGMIEEMIEEMIGEEDLKEKGLKDRKLFIFILEHLGLTVLQKVMKVICRMTLKKWRS